MAVCGDAHSDPCAADQDAEFTFAVFYFAAYTLCIYGVIDGIFGVRSEVHTLVAAAREMIDQSFFVVYAGMIRSGSRISSPPVPRSAWYISTSVVSFMSPQVSAGDSG